MPDSLESLLVVAKEIRELLQLIAEPAIAQRDEKLRGTLQQIIGKSQAKRKAVMLMDGSRSQTEISRAVSIDQGDLSKLVKALKTDELLTQNEKPQLRIPLPANFLESVEGRS